MAKNVVVVGGGYGGVEVAKRLDRSFNVTLVTGGEVLLHVVAGLRALVTPETIPRIQLPYDHLLQRGTVKKCKATKINAQDSTVTIETGESLPYDFLVLATGGLAPSTVGTGGAAATVAEQTTVFKKGHEQLKAATDILIIGGGPIGIETAGEIREEMPDKNVTLVTSAELTPSPDVEFPSKFRARMHKKLQSVGVTVHTNAGRVAYDKHDVNECGFIVGRRTYTWEGGEIEADLCVIATGTRYTPSLYAESGLESWLDDNGYVAVDKTLEVKGAGGEGRVFAVGDCTSLSVPKLAYLAGTEATALAKQVAASAAGKPLKDIAPVPMAVSLVPVGKSGGVSCLPAGLVVGDFITRNIKSKDLFVSKFWRDVNAGKPPAAP